MNKSIFTEFAIWPWLHWASQLDLKVWMILHRIPWSALLKVFSLVALLLLVVAFFLLPGMASTKTLLALDFEVEEKVLSTSISSSSRCLGGCRVSFSESSPSSRPPRLVSGVGWRTQCKWIQCQWCPVLPLYQFEAVMASKGNILIAPSLVFLANVVSHPRHSD